MLTERTLWLGATTVAVALLVLMVLQAWPERRDRSAPRWDEPAAARPAIWRTFRVALR